MKELPTEKYKDIIHLFKEQHFVNRIRSHLERTPVSKKVFVDNIENPTTAVIYVKPRLMFGGKADIAAFNKEISKFIYAILKPVLKEEKISEIDCYLTNNEWIKKIDSIVEKTIFYNRYYYEISELKQKNWRDFIPEGYSLEPVDLSLLEKKYLKNYDWLLEEIEENWKPFDKGLQENRGFYLVKEDKEIVSWCTTEYLTDENEIEVGIATKEEYQKKGFALLVGSATAEYCLTKYKTVGWHCVDSNLGSIKTAEKIGYIKKKEYTQVWCFFNRVDAKIVKGYRFYEEKKYKEAFSIYSQILKNSEAPNEDFKTSYYLNEGGFTFDRFLFRMASICAGMREKERSFKFLNRAVVEGFSDLDSLNNDEQLKSLQNMEEWKEIILKMKSK